MYYNQPHSQLVASTRILDGQIPTHAVASTSSHENRLIKPNNPTTVYDIITFCNYNQLCVYIYIFHQYFHETPMFGLLCPILYACIAMKPLLNHQSHREVCLRETARRQDYLH